MSKEAEKVNLISQKVTQLVELLGVKNAEIQKMETKQAEMAENLKLLTSQNETLSSKIENLETNEK